MNATLNSEAADGFSTADVLNDDPVEDMLRKQQEIKLIRKRIAMRQNFGLAFYKPYEQQDKFHRAGVTHKRRLFRAGNRSGKSTCGCAETCSWLLNERVFYPEGDAARRGGIPQHPVKGLVITTDWDKVDEIWTSQRGVNPGKLWKFLPKGFVKSTKRNHAGAIDTVETSNGSLLRFDTVKSFMSNPQGSESSDWDFVQVDEPLPEDMFKATARGLLDRNGAVWFTLTPLREWWINDFFIPDRTNTSLARDGSFVVEGTTFDNPYLSKAAVSSFAETLTEDEKQCRLMGIPLNLSGLVYKEFRYDKHVVVSIPVGWKSMSEPPKSWPLYLKVDPHPQTPHAVLFCAVSPFGQRFYYYDIFKHCSIENLCAEIVAKTKGYTVAEVRIDPLAYINDPISMSNMATEFIRCGVPVQKATKALEHGVMRVKQELAKDGRIYFTPSATRTLWEIVRYMWDEKDNRPMDKDDHMMECLYRNELSEPRYFEVGAAGIAVNDMVIEDDVLEMDDLRVLLN